MTRHALRAAACLVLVAATLAVPTDADAQRRGSRGGDRTDLEEVVRKLQRARTSAADAARALVREHRQSPERTVRLLATAYPARATADAAVRTLRMKPAEAASALRSAGVEAGSVSESLRRARVGDEAVAGALRRAGYPAKEATAAVFETTRTDPYRAWQVLAGAGYAARDLSRAVGDLGVPLDLDCVGADGFPAPCGDFGSGQNEPVMGQVAWSPHGAAEPGTEVVFESTNIPPVDVLFDGQELQILEEGPSRVRARLPQSTGSGALALRRRSDGVVGMIEDPYEVVAPPPADPMASVDWGKAASVAAEGAFADADAWIMGSRFDGSLCRVNGGVATATPGVLSNPSGFQGNVEKALLAEDIPEVLAEAWQAAFEAAFLEWADRVLIPGLPLYPALASFPGPQAPPMPNVPAPLVTLVSAGVSAMTPPGLNARLTGALPGSGSERAVAIGGFATEVGGGFDLFLATAQVMNVMGQGPIPTFAPPNVPVGPVVGGSCQSPGLWASMLPSGAHVDLPDLTHLLDEANW